MLLSSLKISSFILFISLYRTADSWAQNLVPNPSFETLTSCPDLYSIGASDQTQKAPAWRTATKGTPDLYNVCALPAQYVDVPLNNAGNQSARTGSGYSGIYVHDAGNASPGYREYIQTPLTASLKAGQHYEIVIWVSLSDSSYWAIDELQAHFSGNGFYVNSFNPLGAPYTPQVTLKNGGFLTDETNWMRLSGFYCANGSENYITIGNFKNDAITNLVARPIPVPPPPGLPFGPNKSYYYVDDVSVTEYNGSSPLNLTISNITNATCGSSNGSATVSATGVPGPFTYTWNSIPAQIGPTITGIPAGVYSVVVQDSSGCFTNSFMVPINTPGGPSVNVTAVTNATCFNTSDGAITISVTGGNPGYNYSWTSGATTKNVSGLLPGHYGIVVTDASGCIASDTITIITTPFFINAFALPNCSSNNNNGSATVTLTGGSAPFSYNWAPASSTQSMITNLSPGNYTVTVTDNKGCIRKDSVVISPSGKISGSTTIAGCGGFAKFVTAMGIGGNGNYFYNWTGPPASITNNSAIYFANGTYSVTITDLTCSTTLGFTLPAAALTLTVNATPVLCFGTSSGTAATTIAGGLSPYNYSWSNGQTTAIASGLGATTYTLNITDVSGCTTYTIVSVTGPAAIDLSASVTTASCTVPQGSATISPSGGTGPYTYSWTVGSTLQTISNLISGTYSVLVTDNNGCSKDTFITVGNVPGVTAMLTGSAPASCYASCNGLATVSGSGGTLPYTYLWSNGATNTSAGNLCAAAYTATITDAGGCFSTANVFITEPSLIQLQSTAYNVQCNGDSTGNASITISGGTAPYLYTWSNGTTQSTINNIQGGTYTITVNDNNNCSTDTTIIITKPPVLSYTVSTTNANCGQSNGSATLHLAGGTPGYYYFWSSGRNDSTITNESNGTYTVYAQDNNGCSIQTIATINNTGIPATINMQPNLCLGSTYTLPDGSITGTSGIYSHTLNTIAGCDSVITTQLNIGSPINITQSPGICSGYSYTLPLGTVVSTGGIYMDTLTAIGGCDSIVITNLTVYSSPVIIQNPNICAGSSYTLPNGSVTSTAGIYTHSFTTTKGCDSIITTQLTVNNVAVGNQTLPTTCDSMQYKNQWYYTSQSISDTIPSGSYLGCDSITITSLTLNFSTFNFQTATACNSFTSNSQTYTSTGIYTQTLLTTTGCDSILTINLTISNSISTADTQNICHGQSSIIHGINQDTAGIYTQTFFAAGGCDSISSVLLYVNPIPMVSAGNDTTIQTGQTIVLSASGGASAVGAYSWSTGETTTSITQQPTTTTSYILTVTDNGCTSIDTVTVFVDSPCDNNAEVFVPNSFSPNGDGQNDLLKLYSTGVPGAIYFAIYNRWGEIVFESDNLSNTWDGIYKNKPADTAVFTWVLKITCKGTAAEVIKKGNISLIR